MEFEGPKSSFGSGRLILKFSSNFSWYVCRGVKCPNNIRLRPNTCLRGLVGRLLLTQNLMFGSTSPMWRPTKQGHLKNDYRDFLLMAFCLIPWPQDLTTKLSNHS